MSFVRTVIRATQPPMLFRRYRKLAISGFPALHRSQVRVDGWGLFSRPITTSFLLLVIIPTLCSIFYLGVLASPEYVAEARFVVRSGITEEATRQSAATATALLQGLGSSQNGTQQDAFIVTNYIMGRTIIDDLGGPSAMKILYARPDIDWLSRLSSRADFESVWKYWRRKVSAVLDIPSGLVILEVRAFSRLDAQQLANRVIMASEKLVNEMSEHSRADALGRAEEQFARAKDHVEVAQRELLQFRNAHQLLDPIMNATSTNEVLTDLIKDKLTVENDLATFSGKVSPDSPTQRVQRARLKSLDDQIEALRATLTSQSSDKTISAQLATYQELQLEVKFAENMYQIAAAALERAHQRVERQQLYLLTVVKPVTPESALYPRPLMEGLLVFVWATVLWSVAVLTVAAVRDHA